LLEGIPFQIGLETTGLEAGAEAVIRTADGAILARATLPSTGTSAFPGLVVTGAAQMPITVQVGEDVRPVQRTVIPGWVTIIPSLVAIALALIFREVVTSLFIGVWLGCFFVAGYNPFTALLMSVDRYIRGETADSDHAAILIFSLLLGGMVGVLSRMGAAKAIVDAVSPLATNRSRGQFAAWAAGILIFFDDYANTLIVGNTMRPLTDRLRISREKLSYIVDSTAAPVAAIAFVSTWVGAEVGYIKDGLDQAALVSTKVPLVAPFGVFISTIPYLFYPILALLMVLVLIILGRDFGPMLAAERRAASGGGVSRPDAELSTGAGEMIEAAEGASPSWWMGALPVVVVVVTVMVGLVTTGLAAIPEGGSRSILEIFGHADPFVPLLWGSLLGCVVAILLSVGVVRLPLDDTMGAWLTGIRSMMTAIVILVLAWSLGAVTHTLGTAAFLSTVLSERLPGEALPVSVFIVGSFISFATGTSWGTMAILFPLVIPLSIAMGGDADPADLAGYHLLLGSVAGVMAGALFGDHCSPISDTTVMSSMASGCNHVDHVRTQLPYALTVAAVAAVAGALPAGFGISPWISLAAGGALLFAITWLVGGKVE
ncbi:MAG TPA: Na+/H+ antiporter NhaC family protein, partial [Candidatus Saccharimonadales bacterium]|nr:Na+/H+ antiporter NhaC family protein [Candidatus Saccharimonadales bacterium]